MTVTVRLILKDPKGGMVREDALEGRDDLPSLLDDDAEAGVLIAGPEGRVVVRDFVEGVLTGTCVAGADALGSGETYVRPSFAGYDGAEFRVTDGMAVITSDGQEFTAPVGETVAALKAAAGRYGALLRRVFPDDPHRWEDLEAFGAA